ncbi:MAG: hypothetical protein COU29_03900 [Candidatus Magasanikbacteria bacterium CG10_big_fil_rev_8_21_14_0_10_36_32]|uniref:Uncharacterized protein n=1 Tax=Candidatus Magasanikbacteria bacterium CG10_big_fil_rev_8_21_14_0_10_36_32 TaxID=1974646 RepID=A0A2M6W5P6_9BACT|nr:MAG: hypothetical protein COU29_03900 [Candidatus Magasanikbacteria bacterium CG10_big_fil_rev_8_21_14_0_10_36_32]
MSAGGVELGDDADHGYDQERCADDHGHLFNGQLFRLIEYHTAFINEYRPMPIMPKTMPAETNRSISISGPHSTKNSYIFFSFLKRTFIFLSLFQPGSNFGLKNLSKFLNCWVAHMLENNFSIYSQLRIITYFVDFVKSIIWLI